MLSSARRTAAFALIPHARALSTAVVRFALDIILKSPSFFCVFVLGAAITGQQTVALAVAALMPRFACFRRAAHREEPDQWQVHGVQDQEVDRSPQSGACIASQIARKVCGV